MIKKVKIDDLNNKLHNVVILIDRYGENTSLGTVKRGIESLLKYWKTEYEKN